MAKKKINKKILMITDGNYDHPSSRIRALQYLPYLISAGYKVRSLPRIPKSEDSKSRISFFVKKRINLISILIYVLSGKYNILFIQRFFMPRWLLFYCKWKKNLIIYDFDDAIYLSESDRYAKKKVDAVIEKASLVITSCRELYDYSKKINENSTIITSSVNTSIITPEYNENKKVTIGWIGTKWTTKYLKIIRPVIDELAKKYDIRLLLIGADNSVNFNCDVTRKTWKLEEENLYLNEMDIGIMPLFDYQFERAKGGYKLFQYMAAGKPVLASPVGINTDIVSDGVNGFLCNSTDDWNKFFCQLIEDENLRLVLGKRGRELVVEKYSSDICAAKLIDKINTLL